MSDNIHLHIVEVDGDIVSIEKETCFSGPVVIDGKPYETISASFREPLFLPEDFE